MTSRILNLDTNNPRGWGELGQTNDACEHGHEATELDLEKLKKQYGLEIFHHTINDNQYRFISLLHKDATDTVVSILGGDGKYYVIDSNDIPNGLIMPFFEYCKIKKLNLIIIDPGYKQEHAWSYLIGKTTSLKSISQLHKIPVEITKILRDTQSNKEEIVKHFYIRHYENLKEDFFLQNKTLSIVHTFIKDFKNVLEYIKNLNKTNIWLMGHCTGAVMLSIMHDVNQYHHLYKGMIFLSPYWKKNWREMSLKKMKYFLTQVNKHLLIVQHIEDPCLGVHPEISKKIICDIDKPSLTRYIELNGGINQGCPHFSLGYHGYRGIEYRVIDEINRFIINHSKV
jgi:hypothetical protein